MTLRFGCGEYLPGGLPITVPNLFPPTPGTVIVPIPPTPFGSVGLPVPPPPKVPPDAPSTPVTFEFEIGQVFEQPTGSGGGGSAQVGSSKIPSIGSTPPVGGNPRIQAHPTGEPTTAPLTAPPTVNAPGVEVQNIDIQQGILNQDGPPPNPRVSPSKLYDPDYNLFNHPPKSQGYTNLNSLSKIFKSKLPSSVGKLLNRRGNVYWDETLVTNLTLDDVRDSLVPNLLRAFRVIHRPGGQLVGEESFLEMIRKHLITGTTSEIDINFYLNLANTQSQDKRISYTGVSNREMSERGGLGVISEQSILANSKAQTNRRQWQIRRQRRLNTDIKAKCIICRSGYGEEKEQDIFLDDAGICVVTLADADEAQDNISVPTGDGDGYYMYINQVDLNCTPLVTTNSVDNTYYVPDTARFNALTLFKTSNNVTLTASSLYSHHELTASDTGASALKPLYLALDLKSTGYKTNENPLVSTYTANYNVIEDQDLIDEHTKNNGMAVTRVNIDYRDPLYRYILDTSAVSLTQNDINFKAVNNDPALSKGQPLIARNIPFGLIVTPVLGSKFNPFNGFSTMEYFEDRIVRSLNFTPDINISDNAYPGPPLTKNLLYNDTGGDLKVGLVEPDDLQNIVYKFAASSDQYTKTFYVDGKYQTSSSPVSSNGISYLVKDVLDFIHATYSPNEIVWFDVFRRMPLSKWGELLYNTNPQLINRLERGFRNNMRINYVLNNTFVDSSVFLLADDEKVIIPKAVRKNGIRY